VRTREQIANTASTPKSGIFALLSSLLRIKGTTTPKITLGKAGRLSLFSLPALALASLAFTTTPALATGDANSPACSQSTESSPGFRASLPDCRAFELVSPADGAGPAPATDDSHTSPAFSPDGDQILSRSFGAFAETGDLAQIGEEYGAIYELSRTPAGWSAEAQEPAASTYTWSNLEEHGFSDTDLARSVWTVTPPVASGEEPERSFIYANDGPYVLREGQGDFVPVGPKVAPGHEQAEGVFGQIEGVSGTLNHIVFTVLPIHKNDWPGDSTLPTGSESLYEYHGTDGGEPVLVGVKNSGPPPWQPNASHVNEGAQLVSECGTQYNAMSSSGEVVYFTALAAQVKVGGQKFCTENAGAGEGSGPAVNELYARVDGSRTVKISGAGGAGGAVFQGASEDGSKVFFTEAQDLYEYDLEDQQTTLITAHAASVVKVATDGSRFYFTSTGKLTAAPNGNGETATNGASNLYVYDTATELPTPAFVASGVGAQSFETTADGEFLVFASTSDLRDTDDTSPVPQLFEYDAATGALARVSVGQHAPGGYRCEATGAVEEGYGCDGNTLVANQLPGTPFFEDAPRLVYAGNSVSENGTVVFTSELPLTPGAVQGRALYNGEHNEVIGIVENVYEYRSGQVYLISPGDEALPPRQQGGTEETRLFGIDESGQDIFFATDDSLVPQDTDTQASWYDARVEGGFPAPAAPPGCNGEACQGAGPVTPVFAAPGSNTVTGVGSAAPLVSTKPATKPAAKPKAKTCKKGFVKHEGKCVKTPKSKKAKKAGTKRGTRR
jgi:hypothetical protein